MNYAEVRPRIFSHQASSDRSNATGVRRFLVLTHSRSLCADKLNILVVLVPLQLVRYQEKFLSARLRAHWCFGVTQTGQTSPFGRFTHHGGCSAVAYLPSLAIWQRHFRQEELASYMSD